MFEYNPEECKNHPRVLEVRFILLFDIFEREYGYQAAIKLLDRLECLGFLKDNKFIEPTSFTYIKY